MLIYLFQFVYTECCIMQSRQDREGLSGVYYHSDSVFEKERDVIFERMWILVAREDDLPNPGDYLVRNIGGGSFFLIRGDDKEIRAYRNSCRHRGTQLLEGNGSVERAVQCPYHAWTYNLHGELVGIPDLLKFKDLNRSDLGLLEIRVNTWKGFVFANMDTNSKPFAETSSDFISLWRHLNFQELKRVFRLTYKVKANWKIIVENYSECYHCAPVHPMLNKITPSRGANRTEYLNWKEKRLFSGSFMNIADPYTSMTSSGQTSRSPLKNTREEDLRRIYYYVVIPNVFFSLHPDYLMVHTLWPRSKDLTDIECDFYFDLYESSKPNFDARDAIEIWNEINNQDWKVCESAHNGTNFRSYRSGPLPLNEDQVLNFDDFIRDAVKLDSEDAIENVR